MASRKLAVLTPKGNISKGHCMPNNRKVTVGAVKARSGASNWLWTAQTQTQAAYREAHWMRCGTKPTLLKHINITSPSS
jgi:hypothetical protein